MVAYLTDTWFWIQWISNKGCMSFQGKNIFLTPAHDWTHDFVRNWTRKWDPFLNKIIMWPNRCQGVIDMLIGGMAGQFRKPVWGNLVKLLNPRLAPKGAGLGFSLSLYFGANGLTVSHSYDGLDLPRPRGSFVLWYGPP